MRYNLVDLVAVLVTVVETEYSNHCFLKLLLAPIRVLNGQDSSDDTTYVVRHFAHDLESLLWGILVDWRERSSIHSGLS